MQVKEDFVIKSKDADGNNYVPLYYDNLIKAVVDFRKLQNYEIELLDNNTGEILVWIVAGEIKHKVGYLSDDLIAAQLAREARARWIDAFNPFVFYRMHRPGEAYGLYQCNYCIESGILTPWQKTWMALEPASAVPL